IAPLPASTFVVSAPRPPLAPVTMKVRPLWSEISLGFHAMARPYFGVSSLGRMSRTRTHRAHRRPGRYEPPPGAPAMADTGCAATAGAEVAAGPISDADATPTPPTPQISCG